MKCAKHTHYCEVLRVDYEMCGTDRADDMVLPGRTVEAHVLSIACGAKSVPYLPTRIRILISVLICVYGVVGLPRVSAYPHQAQCVCSFVYPHHDIHYRTVLPD